MTPRRPLRIAGLAVATMLVITACGGGDTTATDSADTTTAGSADTTTAGSADTTTADTVAGQPTDDTSPGDDQPGATAGDVDVPEVLQLSAPLVGGGELDLAGFAGRPVALWFWAPG